MDSPGSSGSGRLLRTLWTVLGLSLAVVAVQCCRGGQEAPAPRLPPLPAVAADNPLLTVRIDPALPGFRARMSAVTWTWFQRQLFSELSVWGPLVEIDDDLPHGEVRISPLLGDCFGRPQSLPAEAPDA